MKEYITLNGEYTADTDSGTQKAERYRFDIMLQDIEFIAEFVEPDGKRYGSIIYTKSGRDIWASIKYDELFKIWINFKIGNGLISKSFSLN